MATSSDVFIVSQNILLNTDAESEDNAEEMQEESESNSEAEEDIEGISDQFQQTMENLL